MKTRAVRWLGRLKAGLMKADGAGEYWQAGKSVEGIHAVKPVAEIMKEFAAALA